MEKFPDEIWIATKEFTNRWADTPKYPNNIRYIHESKVPISCGGTMEENDANALARAVQEWKRDTVLTVCDFSGEDTVLTSGNAEIQCPIKDLCKPEQELSRYSAAALKEQVK
jgi:hypothetical protein